MSAITPVGLPGNVKSSVAFVADASDLGWAPGEVRETITFDGELFRYARATKDDEGETQAWHYLSATARIITVFND